MSNCLIRFVVVCVCLLNTINANPDVVFFGVASKFLKSNSVYKVHLSGEESGTPQQYSVQITHVNRTKPIAQEDVVVEPGKTKIINMEIKNLKFHAYNLTISTEGSDIIIDRAVLYAEKNLHSTFIQTDKPIYKPGETVRFRVIVLDDKFRPFKQPRKVNISMFDANKNLIKIWKNIAVASPGLLSKSLALSSEPNLGDWIIKMEMDVFSMEHSFNVAQYVLPKFKVDIHLPNFLTLNNSKLIADISAKYTFGKPAKGKLKVTLSENIEYHYYIHKHYYGDAIQNKTLIVPLEGASAFVEFDVLKDLNITIPDGYYSEKQFKVEATFTEGVTGLEQTSSKIVKMYQYAYKINLLNPPDSYKPGFPINLTLQISSQDDIPISDPSPNALQVYHGFSWKDQDGFVNFSIPANGLVHFAVDTPSNELVNVNVMKVTYKDLTIDLYLPNKFTAKSKTYIQLYRVDESTARKINETLRFCVKRNKPLGNMKYIILCGGAIVSMKKLPEIPTEVMEQDFNVKVPSGCGRHGQIIIYAVNPQNNEIIADSVKFDIASLTLDNFLNINMSNSTVLPGANISLTLDSKPDSLIALRAVDQSVLILKEDKDINMKAVEEYLESRNSLLNRYTTWGSVTYKLFDDSGVVAITNANIDKPNPLVTFDEEGFELLPRPMYRFKALAFNRMEMMDASPMTAKGMSAAGGGGASESVQNVQIRTEFPETWIFEELNSTNQQGLITQLRKKVPDTITSWIITGFCINNNEGLGVTLNPNTLTTFRPFFISLNVPYSVVSGEVFALQILVHNYMGNPLDVEITVDNEQGVFEYVETSQQDSKTTLKKTIQVLPQDASSVSFLVKPIQFGTKKVTVKAVSALAGDGVSQPLIIKPPGWKQAKNRAILVDLRNGNETFERNITTEFPNDRVAGADQVKLTLIGDMLGATVSNLDKLLELPTGCGEQNMLNFVVDIVILEYLQSTGGLTAAIKEKAVGYLEKGYQRQLTYLRSDDSFSAFGNSDPFGSTWLTAFVIRSFIQAKQFITIDENIITQSLQYLADRQQPHGAFDELGRVLHTELKGGVGSGGLAMSAYTVLTFVEASKSIKSFNSTEVIALGLKYISSRPEKVKKDPYATILIAYTLLKADSPKANSFITLMNNLAKTRNDLKYWQQDLQPLKLNNKTTEPGDNGSGSPVVEHYDVQMKPVSVEMTAYALLITLHDKENMADSLQIARWLTTQRNSQGGFKSTQDTVVGVTALAKFGLATKTKDSDMEIVATYEKADHTFKINKDNELELQEMFLPEGTMGVLLKAMGKGTALAQLSWTYYIESVNPAPAFDLTVKVKKTDTPKKLEVKICGKYKLFGDSNMAVMRVSFPTGFTFEKELFDQAKTDAVLRYETEDGDTRVNIYFDHINATDTCVDVFGSLTHPVAKQAPAQIYILDYYDTSKKARVSYDAQPISICDICQYDKTCKVENCV